MRGWFTCWGLCCEDELVVKGEGVRMGWGQSSALLWTLSDKITNFITMLVCT